MTPTIRVREPGEFPEELLGVAEAVEIELTPVGLGLVFERHPSSGREIPKRFLMVVPPQIAKPMLERLSQMLREDDRPEWLKSH